MKNTAHSHNKLISAFSDADKKLPLSKSTDINILLNRIKLKKKSESRNKIYFSAAVSTGLIIFGALIF
tara:strand:- start:3683 stop:3886 length:204 start_codon:yes stop_codon:yes gene_type:complete